MFQNRVYGPIQNEEETVLPWIRRLFPDDVGDTQKVHCAQIRQSLAKNLPDLSPDEIDQILQTVDRDRDEHISIDDFLHSKMSMENSIEEEEAVLEAVTMHSSEDSLIVTRTRRSELLDVRRRNRILQNTMEDMQKQLDRNEAIVQLHREGYERTKADLKHCQQQLENTRSLLHNAVSERENMERLELELLNSRQNNTKLIAENTRLSASLGTTQHELQEAQLLLDKYRRDLSSLNRSAVKASSFKETITQLVKENRSLHANVNELEEKHNARYTEIRALQDKLIVSGRSPRRDPDQSASMPCTPLSGRGPLLQRMLMRSTSLYEEMSTLAEQPSDSRRSSVELHRSSSESQKSPNGTLHSPNASRNSPNASRNSPNGLQHSPNALRNSPNASRNSPNTSRQSPNAPKISPSPSKTKLDLSQNSPIPSRNSPAPALQSAAQIVSNLPDPGDLSPLKQVEVHISPLRQIQSREVATTERQQQRMSPLRQVEQQRSSFKQLQVDVGESVRDIRSSPSKSINNSSNQGRLTPLKNTNNLQQQFDPEFVERLLLEYCSLREQKEMVRPPMTCKSTNIDCPETLKSALSGPLKKESLKKPRVVKPLDCFMHFIARFRIR